MSAMFENRRSKNSTPSRRPRGYIPSSNFRTATPRERLSMPAVAVAVSSESVSCSTVDQFKVYMSAMFENRRSKNSTPSRRTRGYIPSSNFRTATPRERLSMPAVAVAVSSESVSCSTVNQLKVYMSAMFENRRSKNSTPSRRTRGATFQFPNGDAERTSINARCRRGRVLRVRIVLYSKSIQGLYERDVRKSKIEKLYAKPSNPRVHTFFQFPNGDAERTSVDARCRRGSVLRVRIVLYSKSIQGLYERDVRKSKIEKLYAKPSNPRVPSNFRTATPRERLSMPAVAVAVSSESVSCSTVNQFKVYMSAMFENSKNRKALRQAVDPAGTYLLPISERRRQENVYQRPLSPWQCPPSPYRALQ